MGTSTLLHNRGAGYRGVSEIGTRRVAEMTSRERLRTIISGHAADRCGFWLGWPRNETWPILYGYFGTTSHEEIRRRLGDDFRWLLFGPGAYQHPEGRG